MPNIKLNWSGTQATRGVKQYEIGYKISTGLTYSILTNVTTTDTFGEYTWTGASYDMIYDFRIRTKDVEDYYSIYKYLTISTEVTGNQPPETVDSYIVNQISYDFMDLSFSGASDDYGIKGHEISYKKTTDSTYTTLPFISTTSGSFSKVIYFLTPNTGYDIRVRTQDVFDVWSTTYFEISESTIQEDINSLYRSNSSILSGSGCSVLAIGSNLLYFYGILENGDIVYTSNSMTTPFNGNNRVWLIGSFDGLVTYSIKISTTGVVSKLSYCL